MAFGILDNMGRYCDPRILESTWWAWILADRVPALEPIREVGLLWTRCGDSDVLEHCVASTKLYRFTSTSGIVGSQDLDGAIKASFYPLDTILVQRLVADNYQCEIPTADSWRDLTSMIYKICCGVALNFRPPNDDIKDELIHEAFTHTLIKIRRGKLRFDPGRAPAFNLLTTTIFRIMYSIKNKEKRDRDHRSHLVERLLSGASLPDLNSIRVSKSLINQCRH